MKKKIIYIFCGIFLISMILFLTLFAISGEDLNSDIEIDIEGTWRVVTYVNNNTVELVENEFMVFSNGWAEAYRDGSIEPYASSSFIIDSSGKLELSDISRTYIIDDKSQNHIRLYENSNVYMYLIRYPEEDMNNIEIDTSIVNGRWNVVYRDADNYAGEYLIFEDGIMHDYRVEGGEPTATINYIWNENQIVLSTINKTMLLHIISDTEIAFIEMDTGYIWELEKGND